MTLPGKVEFMKALAGIGRMMAHEVDEFTVEVFCEAIEPHGWPAGVAGLKKIALTSRRFPTVVELLEIVAPQVVADIDDGDNAAVIAGLIEQAMVRHGSVNAMRGYPEARAMIGEVGWSIVGPRWQHLCDTTRNSDLPALKAQWRQEIKGAISRAKAMLPRAPSLPGGVKAEDLLPAHEVLKIEEAKPIEPGSLLDIASKEVKGFLDRQRRASGERDESEYPW